MTEGTTPDGSPLGLYVALGTEGEPDLVHAAIPPGAEILELGCGPGRVTRALLALGHPVVAVDESAEALAFVRGATTVRARIEDLDLGRTFPCVLAMSNLVNARVAARRALLRTCRRHVARNGVVLLERLDPAIRSGISDGEYGGVGVRLEARRRGRSVSGVVTYEHADGRLWTHSFSGSQVLDDAAIKAELARAALRFGRWLEPQRRWLAADPVA